MTATYPVFAPEDLRQAHGTDAVLASLPLSYAPAGPAEPGAVVLVDGAGDWLAETSSAVTSGAAGVIVLHPRPVDVDALRALAHERPPVVLVSTWASNPVVADAGAALRAALEEGSRIECWVTLRPGTDLDRALLDQLTLIRELTGPVTSPEIVHRDEHGYLAEGRVGTATLDLAATCTNALPQRADVRLLTADGSVEVVIPYPETAQPALLSITGPDGHQVRPTRFESGDRATWRRLHELLSSGQPATDLEGFATDVLTLASLTSTKAGAPAPASHP